MAQLLVSYFMQNRRSVPYGLRIWDDGRVESFDLAHENTDDRGHTSTEDVKPASLN